MSEKEPQLREMPVKAMTVAEMRAFLAYYPDDCEIKVETRTADGDRRYHFGKIVPNECVRFGVEPPGTLFDPPTSVVFEVALAVYDRQQRQSDWSADDRGV